MVCFNKNIKFNNIISEQLWCGYATATGGCRPVFNDQKFVLGSLYTCAYQLPSIIRLALYIIKVCDFIISIIIQQLKRRSRRYNSHTRIDKYLHSNVNKILYRYLLLYRRDGVIIAIDINFIITREKPFEFSAMDHNSAAAMSYTPIRVYNIKL